MIDTINYITHDEFQIEVKSIRNDIRELKTEVQLSEMRISKQLSKDMYDTYLRLIPIILTLMGMQFAITFFVVKTLVQ